MEIRKKIKDLESLIINPSEGLLGDMFLFVSRLTPMINVDLLIKNKQGYTLLTWRDDICGSGWHIPGGIIRYKETISDRINAVAKSELRASVKFKEKLLAINECIHPSRKNRGHFISLLYECELIISLDKNLKFKKGMPKSGQWAWHKKCPDDLLPIHKIYQKYI